MLNQLTITPMFIKALETVCKGCEIGINHIKSELEVKQFDKSIVDILLTDCENQYASIGIIESFIERATHDERGEKICQ